MVIGLPSFTHVRVDVPRGEDNGNNWRNHFMKNNVTRLAGLVLTFAASAVAFSISTAKADPAIYQLDGDISEGIDLTAMSGYYADRMEGPSSANMTFAGPIIVDSSVSASNPFQLMGRGYKITVSAAGSGFHTLPLRFQNADGVTKTSELAFDAGNEYGAATVDVGRGGKISFGYMNNGNVTLSGEEFAFHDGGKMAGYNLYFGKDNSPSLSVVDGAEIAANYTMRLGNQTKSIPSGVSAFLGMTNATVSTGATENRKLQLLFGVPKSQSGGCDVVLGEGAVLSSGAIELNGGGIANIVFDGGAFKSTSDADLSSVALFQAYGYSFGNAKQDATIVVQAANGNPIDVEINQDRRLASVRANSAKSLAVNLTGDGGFTKRGSGVLAFVCPKESSTQTPTCDYTGPTTVLAGGIVVSDETYKVGRGALAVSENAFLDLNGFDVEFSGATGDGIVTNGAAATSTLTLGYGGADGAFSVAVGERIHVVKTGAGTLTISGAALANACDLTVSAGTVAFAGDSTTFGTVTVASGATLDAGAVEFSCSTLVKQPGSAVLLKPKATTLILR